LDGASVDRNPDDGGDERFAISAAQGDGVQAVVVRIAGFARNYFGGGESAFRPYVGLGATYVWYSDVELSSGLQNTLGARFGLPPGATTTSAKLDGKFAPVVNVGAAYQFDKNWGVSFSVSYIPLKTTAKLTTTTTATGAPVSTSEASLKVNPIVPYLAVTYRF